MPETAGARNARWDTPGKRLAVRATLALLTALTVGRFAFYLPATHAPRTNVDFPAYYEAGRQVLDGGTAGLYGREHKEFQNLPVVAVLVAPLALLDYDTAWYVLWWIGLGSIAATLGVLLAVLRRFFPPLSLERALLASILYLWFAPVMHRSLLLGQTTPLLVLLFAGSYALLRWRRPVAAGLLLGVVCLIKIPPLAVAALLALRKRYRAAGACAVVLILSVALSVLLLGPQLNLQYFDRVLWTNANKALAAYNNQSLLGSLMRVATDRGLRDWRLEPVPTAVSFVYRAAVLLILGAVAWRMRRLPWPDRTDGPSGSTLELELAIGVAVMLLAFPIAWIHYYQFLVVPVTILPLWWRRAGLGADRWTIAILGAGTLLAAAVVHESPAYATHGHDLGFRILQCSQTAGAALLLWGFMRLAARWPHASQCVGAADPARHAGAAAPEHQEDAGE